MTKTLALLIVSLISAQCCLAQNTTKSAAVKPGQATLLKMCTLPTDSTASTKIPLADAQAWADETPLKVVCNDGNVYSLNQFTISIISLKPLQTTEYGLANNGIPILARKAIDTMKPGDTIFLKGVSGKDKSGKDLKLPNVVFVIKDIQ